MTKADKNIYTMENLSCRGLSLLDDSGKFHGCGSCNNCKKSIQKIFNHYVELKKDIDNLAYELSECHKNYFKSNDEFAYEDVINKVDDVVYSLRKMMEKFS